MSRQSTVSEGIVMHRLLFPDRDIRDVVRTSEDLLLEECRNSDIPVDVDSLSYLGNTIRKYLPKKLPELKSILGKAKVRGPSTFTHTAACVAAAEREIETERMSKRDQQADELFVLEDKQGDVVQHMDHHHLIVPTYSDDGRSITNTQKKTNNNNKKRMRNGSLPSDGVFQLDQHQRRAVEIAKITKLTMINAGPGTGKTTTLSVLIKEMLETSHSAKILFLSFTKKAETVMKDRLMRMGLEDLILDSKDLYQSPGICVLTFDKYAYTLTKQMFQTYSLGKQESIPHLQDLSKQGIKLLDYLIVDECQDLSLVEYQMMKAVSLFSHQTVLAGDPRQECFSECSYFGKDWCAQDESDNTCKVHLLNNYRSCRCLVSCLNLFAKIHFPNIGGSLEQVSMRGKCQPESRGDDCLRLQKQANYRKGPGGTRLQAQTRPAVHNLSAFCESIRK